MQLETVRPFNTYWVALDRIRKPLIPVPTGESTLCDQQLFPDIPKESGSAL